MGRRGSEEELVTGVAGQGRHDSGLRLDHVVIRVAELARAIEDYRTQGFNVSLGGEHAGGLSRNALIPFRDGSYLELIEYLRPPPVTSRGPLDSRFLRHGPGFEGLVDFALVPVDIRAVLGRLQRESIPAAGPLPGGRRRPDGVEIAWQLGIPATPELPFLCADTTPRELRVAGGTAAQHANGAAGVAEIVIGVRDVPAACSRYGALLGRIPAASRAVEQPGGSSAFQLGGVALILASAGSELPGPKAIRLTGLRNGGLAPSHTHGVAMEFVGAPEGG